MTAAGHMDALSLAVDLIRCPSVTPDPGGALDVLEAALTGLGFKTERMVFSEPGTPDVDNLYARIGDAVPVFCFAGHTDVVPAGELASWSVDPFSADVKDGVLTGRGAADMKAAIACFTAAAARFIGGNPNGIPGSIALLITGDEEGPAINGTRKMLERLEARGEKLDMCVVGEPTNPNVMGEMIKIGRRGSLNGVVTVLGRQGHVGYPHLAKNPLPGLAKVIAALSGPLDEGTDHFQPSNLEITKVEAEDGAENVIPGTASARFNIRFTDQHSGDSLGAWLRETIDKTGVEYKLETRLSGEAFLTEPGLLSDLIVDAIESRLNNTPELSTTGGTSDARFIKDMCPVVEFGMVGRTMHSVDEQVQVADIEALTDIYHGILTRVFPAPND